MSGLPEEIRAFVAVELPASAVAALADLQSRLKGALRNVAWTRPEAMHLTLRFLGNIRAEQRPGLVAALDRALNGRRSFLLRLGRPGSFGGRVVWVGLETPPPELGETAAAIHAACAPFSAHDEKREFNPHITLGRMRRPWSGCARAVAAERFEPPPTWRVDTVKLLRSELRPGGSRYTALAEFALAKG
jgi:2'-5' RNA ligase